MNRLRSVCISLALMTFLFRAGAAGQGPSPAAPGGFRGDFLGQLGDVEKKLLDLGTAMPEEKYSWRPGEGVRSVSEVYVHVAIDNYTLPAMIGGKVPKGISRDMEKTLTAKAKVLDFMKESFAHLRELVSTMPDADLSKPAKFFGRETTVQGVLFAIANHMHEHLGQSIAYARMNGVVPPWTAERQAKAAQQKQKDEGVKK